MPSNLLVPYCHMNYKGANLSLTFNRGACAAYYCDFLEIISNYKAIPCGKTYWYYFLMHKFNSIRFRGCCHTISIRKYHTLRNHIHTQLYRTHGTWHAAAFITNKMLFSSLFFFSPSVNKEPFSSWYYVAYIFPCIHEYLFCILISTHMHTNKKSEWVAAHVEALWHVFWGVKNCALKCLGKN